ncbi:GNAT family N-acetyltransferase [Aestuariimicrobium sp. Y1814]|uniref:GNAT family N-acetyltransferase n=1 Tax=Aestuariimicrobium sp. Y1814 TaxID=3418742 RepID=UPI003DA797D7
MPERATVADADQLAELDRACFAPGERWSAQLWRDELEVADRLVVVQRDRDLMAAATFAVAFEIVDLHRVLVRPTHRGLGLARQLITAGALWAGDRGAERMLLEVRHDNTAALTLYELLGFTTIDTRRDYYGTGLHAHVMQCDLRGMTRGTNQGDHRG